jgi:hypothetical protein
VLWIWNLAYCFIWIPIPVKALIETENRMVGSKLIFINTVSYRCFIHEELPAPGPRVSSGLSCTYIIYLCQLQSWLAATTSLAARQSSGTASCWPRPRPTWRGWPTSASLRNSTCPSTSSSRPSSWSSGCLSSSSTPPTPPSPHRVGRVE